MGAVCASGGLAAALLLPSAVAAPAVGGWLGLPDTFEQPFVEIDDGYAVLVIPMRAGAPPLLPDQLDLLLETAAGRPEADGRDLRVVQRWPDGLDRSLPPVALPKVPEKEPWARVGAQAHARPGVAPRTSARVRSDRSPPPAAADLPGAGLGALSGKAVYLSQCHGWVWYDTLDAFSTQRGNLFDTVEDLHNPEGANQQLARYLENAGGRVYTTKERDLNPDMAIADNDGDGYAEAGAGFVAGPAGFLDLGGWDYGDNPFVAGTTRRFPADGGGVASWIPEVPADGVYAVYLSWDSASDQSEAAHYRIHHPGGVIDRTFNQRVHGSTWQYAETLWLPAGVGGLRVELIGDSGAPGEFLSADAVRIGGGRTDVRRHGVTAERPRWEDGAVQYTQWNGAPTSVYDPFGDGNGSDPAARSRWAAWERPSGEDAVYLSWHSNAGGGRGTSVYIYEGSAGPAVAGSEELGALVQDELIEAIQAIYDRSWSDRGVRTAAFAEVSPTHNSEFPSALVELAFHDDITDTEALKNPRFREDSSRAMARGIIRYFAERDGLSPTFPPEPPLGLALVHREDGLLVARWDAGAAGAPYGDPATAFRVYTSLDGRSWDNGADLSVPEAVLDVAPGEAVYVRVTGLNAGGESFPSEVMGARRMPEGRPPILVVAAFDRLQTSQLDWETLPRVGAVRRMRLERLNPFDTAAVHGRAVVSAGFYMDSIADEQLEAVELGAYPLLIWAAGEESTTDEAISDAQQAILRAYLEGGGKLIASGSEMLWDLDELGSASDHAFLDEVLGLRLLDDDSDSDVVFGEGPLAGLSVDFSPERSGCYPVEWPDVYTSAHPTLARYATGGPAGVGDGTVAAFGFPLECAGDEADRAAWFGALLPHMLPDWVEPELPDGGDGGADGGASDGAADGADGGGADGGGLADDGGGGAEGSGAPGKGVGLGGLGCSAPRSAAGGPLGAALTLLSLAALLRMRRRSRA